MSGRWQVGSRGGGDFHEKQLILDQKRTRMKDEDGVKKGAIEVISLSVSFSLFVHLHSPLRTVLLLLLLRLSTTACGCPRCG